MKNLLWVALGIVSAVVCMEVMLQFTDSYDYQQLQYDPSGLILYKPHIHFHSSASCYDVPVTINNLGYYGPEVGPKSPDTKRIIVVGSSYAEGIQVPLDKRFDQILQQKFVAQGKKVEVISLGFPANGTYLSILYFRHYIKALEPDLVIDLLVTYDLEKDAPTTIVPPRFETDGKVAELPAIKRDSNVLWLKSTARRSKLFEALYRQYLALRATFGSTDRGFETVSTSTPIATWDTEEKLLTQFNTEVKSSGSKFLIASWTPDEVSDRTLMGSHVGALANTHSISYIDLTPYLDTQESSTGESAMLSCGGHWGEWGHQWVAEDLYNYLKTHAF
jgi:hypothetical protein